MSCRCFSRLLLCGVVLSGFGIGPALAQDESRADIAMQNQILELRHDLDTLRQQVASGTAGSSNAPAPAPATSAASGGAATPPGDMTAQLLDRVSRLEDQVRALQGSVDQVQNGLQQQNADLTKQIGDLTFRVQTLEGGTAATPAGAADSAAPARPSPVAPPVAPAAPPSHLALQHGMAALARRDYAAAATDARAELASPSPRAYDAQFLLAEALAGQRNYQQAALAYDDTYNKQRKGAHAPDALVGLARALSALADNHAACATLDKLHIEFPTLRPEVKASASAVGRHANCP